ncbi:aryl-alcohol dehydrogenase-like predicted oxidoreductase [Pseudarthrobacter sp. PvP090]
MNGTMEDATTAELNPGVRIPLIGLGTWPLAGEDATAAVAQASGSGYRHIDTAENYANEAAVGEGIRRSGIDRCDVLVVGSGAGGLSAAVTAAYHGLNVIVVEGRGLRGCHLLVRRLGLDPGEPPGQG